MKKNYFVDIVGITVLYALLLLAALILRTSVFILLWQWFVLPLGLKPLNFTSSLGILLLIDFLTNQYQPLLNEKQQLDEAVIYLFVYPTLILLISWLIHFSF